MSIKKDESIKEILEDFEALSNLVLTQLDLIEHIITDGELHVHKETINSIEKNENQVDKLEVKLSKKIIDTIVLYHPIASELRKIMACYRMIISLERISDHAIAVASFLKKLKSPEVFDQFQEVLHNMIIQGNRMVREALLSFLNNNRELAVWTLRNEVAFDEMNSKLIKKTLNKKSPDESKKKVVVSIIRIKEVMSNIERIADHGTNIAAASIYYLDGKNIRHQKIAE